MAKPEVAQAPVARAYHVIDGHTGEPLDEAGVTAALEQARVVFVGEQHDNPHHHHIQMQMLARVHAIDPSVAVGFEMLPATMQDELDAFVGGDIDAAAFVEAVDWPKTWGFPFGLYAPLLQFCRDHGLAAHALNVPRTLVRAVSRGGLEGLSAEQRAAMPELVPGPAAHREYAREAFGMHARSRFAGAKFERFYAAQLTWDEAMAAQVVAALQGQQAPQRLVVIAGEGHTRPFAMPARVARRGVSELLTVLGVEPDEVEAAVSEEAADLLLVFEGD